MENYCVLKVALQSDALKGNLSYVSKFYTNSKSGCIWIRPDHFQKYNSCYKCGSVSQDKSSLPVTVLILFFCRFGRSWIFRKLSNRGVQKTHGNSYAGASEHFQPSVHSISFDNAHKLLLGGGKEKRIFSIDWICENRPYGINAPLCFLTWFDLFIIK